MTEPGARLALHRPRHLALAGFGLAALLVASGAALADESAVTVTHARIRWLPADLPMAGYFEIANGGGEAIRLTGAHSPDYAAVMLHRTTAAGMVPAGDLTIAPGRSIEFAPGGLHLMLTHRRRAIAVGDHVPITLELGDAGTVTADFTVGPADLR